MGGSGGRAARESGGVASFQNGSLKVRVPAFFYYYLAFLFLMNKIIGRSPRRRRVESFGVQLGSAAANRMRRASGGISKMVAFREAQKMEAAGGVPSRWPRVLWTL